MSESDFELVVNGRRLRCHGRITVADIVSFLEQDRRAVAVEYEGRILQREAFTRTLVTDGSRMEVVRFVQGG